MSNKGILYGVSLGPGDPGFITRRAWEVLRQDTVWAYPIRNKKSESFALGIAQRAGLNLPKQHTPLIFPMTHDTELLAKYWLQAAQTALEFLLRGQDVSFLVEGDASTYSTFGYLARTVAALDPEIKIEIIPGVSSFHAAAARLQSSLADQDDTVAIIPAAYGIPTIERLLADFDTLVLLKVKPLLDDIIDLLEQHNLLEHSYFVEKAGTPNERVIRDVRKLRGQTVNYLSLLMVKNPQRQRSEMIRGCRKKSSNELVEGEA